MRETPSYLSRDLGDANSGVRRNVFCRVFIESLQTFNVK
jgi:hypothetical protein